MPTYSSGIVDVSAQPATAPMFWLLGVLGPVTASGYFVSSSGERVGAPFSTVLNAFVAGASTPLRLVTAANIPAGAVGAYVNLTGDVYFDLQPESVTTAPTAFSTANTWGPRKVAMTSMYNTFGRIG